MKSNLGFPASTHIAVAAPRHSMRRSRMRISSLPAILFIVSVATFVQSFFIVKAFFLALFLVTATAEAATRKLSPLYPRLGSFYFCVSLVGILGALVGFASNQSDYLMANYDALRLYVVWSIVILIALSLLRSQQSVASLHIAIVIAGILISATNLFAIADHMWSLNAIPDGVRQEMHLHVGIHDGYVRINSINIGALFVIVPYLLSIQFRKDARPSNSRITKLSLVLCLCVAVLSGRRALWIIIALTPFLILLFSVLSNSLHLVTTRKRQLLYGYALLAVTAVGLLVALPAPVAEGSGSLAHIRDSFSSEDERAKQMPYLIQGFAESPILGSGFGAYAGYQRSEERPWSYELTYHQMLFNIGIVGTSALVILFSLHFVFVIGLLRRFQQESLVPFSLLVGLCALFIGAYSNPYLRSFDYLFLVGFLPYLSTFTKGFES